MFETPLTIIGNVLAAPELRRTATSGHVAASFRVASSSRRFDKTTNEWVDGNSLRVRVTCWRKLAEGVVQSLATGDPVVVVGRLYTRDWTDEAGVRRVLYEMDAVAVGHDLSRGTGVFKRNSSALGTSVIEDEEESRRIGDEDSEPFSPALLTKEDDVAEDDDFDDIAEDRRELAGV